MNEEEISFEDALARLEEIVEALDDESLSLEKSIALYEEGITLSRQCSNTLEEAELRIERVNEEQADE